MTLHLIRHGKTEANKKRLYCGATDLPLCEEGIAELISLKESVSYPKGDFYISSGLLRTKQTADILFDNPNIITIELLNEINFGEFEMKSYEELKTNKAYQSFISDIENVSPLGGEGKKEFVKRVMRGFFAAESICNINMVSNAIIVTHGGVIATIMEQLFIGQKNFYEWQPDCGRGYSLCFKNAHNIEHTKI